MPSLADVFDSCPGGRNQLIRVKLGGRTKMGAGFLPRTSFYIYIHIFYVYNVYLFIYLFISLHIYICIYIYIFVYTIYSQE